MNKSIVCMSDMAGGHLMSGSKGEWSTIVIGEARKELRCDRCGEIIEAGDVCGAETRGSLGEKYERWEDEFVELRTGKANAGHSGVKVIGGLLPRLHGFSQGKA